jgi:hypothetical protein
MCNFSFWGSATLYVEATPFWHTLHLPSVGVNEQGGESGPIRRSHSWSILDHIHLKDGDFSVC